MIRTQFLLAIRNFIRFKTYSLINLIGLSFGLTVGILSLLYVTDELSFDQFHSNKDNIYKVTTVNADGSIMETNAWPVARKLEDENAEILASTYSLKAPTSMKLKHENNRYAHNIHYADQNFFKIFSFGFLEGDSTIALNNPYSVVITQQIRNLYFGDQLVLGKTIVLRDSLEFTITGVVEDVPAQSHIQFDMLASFSTYVAQRQGFSYSEWGTFNVRNYVLIDENADHEFVRSKATNLYRDNISDLMKNYGVDFTVRLVPLKDIYLDSSIGNQFGPVGSKDRLRLIILISILIICLACINFINITTARSTYRAREVGIKKLVGSKQTPVFWQFILEAMVMMVTALIVSTLLIEFSLSSFNNLLDKNYTLNQLLSLKIISGIAILLLLIGFGAGAYPALVLSRIGISEGIKGKFQSNRKGLGLRRVLVVSQFAISALLLVGTFTILNQLNYMRNQNLGFAKDQIVVLHAQNLPRSINHNILINRLKSISSVESVTYTNALPSQPGWQGQWAYDAALENADPVDMEYMAIDEQYLNTLGLKLLAGENFSLDKPANLDAGLIINESAVKAFGWESPSLAIGKEIVSPSRTPQGIVIGVVEDYHGLGLQQAIWPKAMDYTGGRFAQYYAVRFTTGQTSSLISDIRKEWQEVYADNPIDYFFLDDAFNKQYNAEEKLMRVFILFSGIGLFIALIGLLGMVAFIIRAKMKELSIRKVHGASTIALAGFLSREFFILIIVANILIIAPGWYFSNEWLSEFAYHTNFNPAVFLVNLILTLFLASITVGFQLLRAANINPARLLRID